MNDRDILRKERLERVTTFRTDNATDFTPGGKAAKLFDGVASIVADLDKAKVGQLRTPVTKATLLDALRLDLQDIARTARAIGLEDPAFPVGAYSPVPHADIETPLLTHADAVLELLEDAATDTAEQKAAKAALRALFIDYEMPDDFVEDLRADREAITAANSGKTSDNLEGVESTSAIDTLLLAGGKLVVQLDALVRNKYKRNPDKLRAWQSASRVERRAKPAANETTPAPAPAPQG
jgi:hypothetical protein